MGGEPDNADALGRRDVHRQAPATPLKVKLLLIKGDKVSVKPSNKVVSTILSKIANSGYNLRENEWTFDTAHYGQVALEMKRNKIVFEGIPPGTLALARRPIPDEKFVLEGEIYGRLMKFQREAVLFALNRNGRVLLADDMGLGKTIQAMAIANFYRLEYPLLVIAPASLQNNWKDSLLCFLGEEATIVRQKLDFGDRISIISYNLAVALIDTVRLGNYGVIICDECHYLKSTTSKRTKCLLPVLQKASRLIMISGTPATSRPLELYPVISALDKTAYPVFSLYGNRYCNGKKIRHFYDYRGCSNASELGLAIENAFMIRRLKSVVLGELPKKFRRQVILDCKGAGPVGGHAALLGDAVEGTVITEFSNAAKVKKDPVLKYLETISEKNVKSIVFAHHGVMLDELEGYCKEKGTPYIRIDGSTVQSKRHSLVESFQSDDSVRFAILSITACSTGLTLTAAKAVIFAELYWNPGTMLQAEDRIHRIGQVDSVDIHYLVAKGTIDEMVWPQLLKKLTVLESLGIGQNELKYVKGSRVGEKRQTVLDDFM